MKLPAMKYLEGNRKKTQVRFGGLNQNAGAKDGELLDMKNLTGDHYPVLATREPRTKIKNFDVSGGMMCWGALCWIDATDFYYDGDRKGGVEEGVHTLAAIGPYIVIFPEKFYYNKETDEFGDLQAFWNAQQLRFAHVDADGLWDKHDIIECQDDRDLDFSDLFREGDAVTINGCTKRKENNITAVIRHIDRNALIFDAGIFTITEGEDYTEEGDNEWALTIERRVPDLKFICENGNRLWGCDDKRIYASMPGDPFRWKNREGLETDGWDVDTVSAGAFTGCISYQGSPIFFKEKEIYKIYGSIPSQYQLVATEAQGVMKESEKSLAVANGILFYLSHDGVMAYSGGVPQCISGPLGLKKFRYGVAGSDGIKYYISMQNGEEYGLYVYDTRIGLWFKEDNTEARSFAYTSGFFFMQTKNTLEVVGESEGYDKVIQEGPEGPEGPVEWFAEFADFTEDNPDKKGISKIQIRLELDEGASVQVWMMFDTDGQWVRVGEAIGKSEKRSRILPIIPRRADHYRLKLTGIGGCRIYSLTMESYSGSELKSREGRN